MLIVTAIVIAAIGVRLLARRGVHPVLDKELGRPGADLLDLTGKRLP